MDGTGNAHVTGDTTSPGIPLVNPIQDTLLGFSDAFVMKLNASGSARLFSTYLGGGNSSTNTNGTGIAVDAAGGMYGAGHTSATDFPLVNPFQPGIRGSSDVFVAKIADIANNTPVGSSVVVQPVDMSATLTFDSVTTAGVTSLIRRNDGPAPPAGFSLGTPPTYYDIKTTATFTSLVSICVAYNPAQFDDPSRLRLFHSENSAWVDVTTSNNPGAGIICGQTSSLSPFLAAERAPLAVAIDIKPGSYPNTINLGSNGVVPVAIMSTPTFDARTVDPTTVTLASAAVKLTGKGKPIASFQDVNGDGRLDLVVQVETSALHLTSTDTIAVLKGKTFSGQPIKGSDSVRIVPQ